MDNIINKINNTNIWIIAFVLIFFINLVYVNPSGDDITLFGGEVLWPQNMSFIEAAIKRYMEWSPRILAEWITYFFAHNFLLFKIVNSVICVIFVYLLYKLIKNYSDNNLLSSIFICLFFVCMYPWKDMGTAGYATTFIFYLWPFTALLYVFYIMIKYNNNIKISIKEYVIYSLLLLFASNIEQTVVYIVIFSLIFIIYNIRNNIKKTLYIVTFIISILGLVFLLTAPGEANRFMLEIPKWYPTYEMLSFMDKMNLGLTSTMFHFIKSSEAMILYLFFLIGLLVMVWNKYPNKYYYILMMFNFIWIIIGMHLNINEPIVTGMEIFEMINGTNIISFSGYLPISISILLLLWPCIGLYLIYNEDNKKSLMIIFIYLFSFGDRFIMGFSPTVFASSTRTYLPVFIMLIFINSLIYINIFQYSKNGKTH